MEEMFGMSFIGKPVIVFMNQSVIWPNRLVTCLALFLLTSVTFGSTNLTDLARRVEEVASGAGISAQEQKLAEEIQRLGAPAVPALLPLLKHKERDVCGLASYILRDIDGITEEHLDLLIEARLRGNARISTAIARIGTPKAIAFLAKELKKEKQHPSQLTCAFELLGEKGIPYLIEFFRKEQYDPELLYTVIYVLGELGAKAESAVDPLAQIALDEKIDSRVRIAAVKALGSVGSQARRSIPALRQLSDQFPRVFQDAVDEAIVRMGGAEAGPILTKWLSGNPEKNTFLFLAELWENGRAAGPSLVRLLDHKDWDTRVCAARCLEYIGYTNAGPHLIELLKNLDDWRLVFVSIESLQSLQVRDAVPALAVVSQTHWYPPVRKAALEAIEAIENKTNHESGKRPSGFEFCLGFWAYEHICADKNTSSECEYGWRDYIMDCARIFDHWWMMRLRYAMKQSFRDLGKEYTKTRIVVPDVSIRVDNGYVVGRNRGEFGGELMFIGKHGKQTLLLQENTVDIHRMASGIVAVTGLNHMFNNRGGLYRISKDDTGWKAAKWKVLPGAPRYSRLLKDGDLFVACGGGNIRMSSVGDIRMADECDLQAVRDEMLANSVWRVVLLLGGFVLVPLCAIALFFPYFRVLPYRFILLGAAVIPFAFMISIVVSGGFGGQLSLFSPLITACLLLSWTPIILSMISIVRQGCYSRTKKKIFLIFDVLHATGFLWTFGTLWMMVVAMFGIDF
jgi:HEAT repeat protein